MLKKIGKVVFLFLLAITTFFGSFAWEILLFKNPHLNFATVFGIFVVICCLITDRWLKWKGDSEFRIDKFIWPFVYSIFTCVPVVIFIILPIIGQPRNVWAADSLISFFVTGYLMVKMSPTAIAKNAERLQNDQKSNGERKEKS